MSCIHKYVPFDHTRLYCERCGHGLVFPPPPSSPPQPPAAVPARAPKQRTHKTNKARRRPAPLLPDEPVEMPVEAVLKAVGASIGLDEQEARDAEKAWREAWMEAQQRQQPQRVAVPIDEDDDTLGGTYSL